MNHKNKNLVNPVLEYSDKVFINFSDIFKESDAETSNVIWNHLLTISALVDPSSKAKEILKNKWGLDNAIVLLPMPRRNISFLVKMYISL